MFMPTRRPVLRNSGRSSRVNGCEVDARRIHHRGPGSTEVPRRDANRSAMVNGCAGELRKKQVRTALVGNAHGLLNACSWVEHEEAVRRGAQDAAQCRRSLLMPPRESPGPRGIRYGACEPKMKAVRRRHRPGLAEIREGARYGEEREVVVDDDHSELERSGSSALSCRLRSASSPASSASKASTSPDSSVSRLSSRSTRARRTSLRVEPSAAALASRASCSTWVR
jgi:hypothetical protein